jgi:hypothetical protein
VADDLRQLILIKKKMEQFILWLKAAVERMNGANEVPSLGIDIEEELDRIDEWMRIEEMESTELGNFSFELD